MRPCLGFVLCAILVPAIYGQSKLDFPQMVVGGGYETVIQIINEVEADNTILIEVFDGWLSGASNGTPCPVQFDGGDPASTRSITLRPFQEVTTTLTLPGSTIQNGWVAIHSATPGGKVSGNLIFRQKDGGRVADSVGVASSQRYRHGVIQIDERDDGSYTGLAFVNPNPAPVTVALDLFQAAEKVASFSSVAA